MSTAMIIYIASIVNGVCFGSVFMMFVTAIATLVVIINSVEHKNYKVAKIASCIGIPLFMFFLVVTIFVPNSDSVYKIAGVTGQQKAIIDATGGVIKQRQAEQQ